MPLQKLPVAGLDDINHRRRARETINGILDHSFDDSKVRTAQEISDGITPYNPAFPPGDARRYSATATYQGPAWYCYGHVGTFISATQFSVPTDQTAIYHFAKRIMVLDTANVQSRGRITVTAFGTETVVTVAYDSAGTPNPIAAILVAAALETDGAGVIEYDFNGIPFNQHFWNKSNGTGAVSRVQIHSGVSGTGSDVGMALIAIHNSYGSFPYISGGPSGRQVLMHTGVSAPFSIGVFDVCKITFTVGNNPTHIYTDLNVVNNQSGATGTTSAIDTIGGTARLSLRVSGAENGFFASSNTPEILMGTNSAIDVSMVHNGVRVLSLNGANATGASIPTVTVNKPGANNGIIAWLSVKTGAGVQGWIPIWGN